MSPCSHTSLLAQVYIDVDVECIQPLDSLFEPLVGGAAWMGDFPEPMFIASAPGARLWSAVMKRIALVWPTLKAWEATGPSGLNAGVMEYIKKHGSRVLVPFVTNTKVGDHTTAAAAAHLDCNTRNTRNTGNTGNTGGP